MIQLVNKQNSPPTSGMTGMTEILKTNAYINYGEMLDCSFINAKFNYYRPDTKIDLHRINYSNNTYINLGVWVHANEINYVINEINE
jgi:hypothetical protein